MFSYGVLFAVLLIGGCISLIPAEKARKRTFVVYCATALPLIWLFAWLRAPNVDRDYQNYIDWFQTLSNGGLAENLFAKDPMFAVIGFGVKLVGLGIPALMSVYAALCLTGQSIFSRWIFAPRWLPLGFFLILCRFFIPHEMTQIRVGAAIPLASLAIIQFERRRVGSGILLYILAVFSHAAVLLALPVICILLFRMSLRSRWWIGLFVPLAFIGKIIFGHAAIFLAAFSRTGTYVTGAYDTEGVRLLSVYVLFRAVPLLILCVFFWAKLNRQQRLIMLCSTMGLFLQIALSINDALAIRGAEIFGLFDVAVALLLFSYLKPRQALVYALFLLALGGVFFRSSTTLMQPYSTVLSSVYGSS